MPDNRSPRASAIKSTDERHDANRRGEDEVSRTAFWVNLVQFIAAHGAAAKLLAAHRPGTDGRCPTCSAGASSSGRVKSPCTLFLAALAAEKLGRPRGRD
jgi:hypothetical protein